MEQFIEFVGNHPYLSGLFVALLVALIASELLRKGRGYPSVSPQEAVRLMNHNKAVALDVRESNEYDGGHVVDAIHIPLSELNEKADKLQKYKKRPVIAYCRSGHRSGTACARLQKMGFESVYNLRGGIGAWQRDNLPLRKD